MSLRPTRRDWPLIVAGTAITVAGVRSSVAHHWEVTAWTVIALAYLIDTYIVRKNADRWRDAYYTEKARADRATWGERLS